VFDGHKVDALVLVIDGVDQPVISAPRAVQSFEPEPKRLADAVRIRRQRPVAELNDRRRYLLRQPTQRAAGRRSQRDRILAHQLPARNQPQGLILGQQLAPASAQLSQASRMLTRPVPFSTHQLFHGELDRTSYLDGASRPMPLATGFGWVL
jgi:hypothetical protein